MTTCIREAYTTELKQARIRDIKEQNKRINFYTVISTKNAFEIKQG